MRLLFPGRSRSRASRGFAILCVLMAVAIVGILSGEYMSADVPGGKPWAVQQQDRARSAVAAINLRTAQTNYFMKTEGRRPPIDELRRMMDEMSRSHNSAARYFVDHREQLRSTISIQTPKFSEKYQLPRIR